MEIPNVIFSTLLPFFIDIDIDISKCKGKKQLFACPLLVILGANPPMLVEKSNFSQNVML